VQQTDRIDVLTTQLAQTDRRALSQAWYSALRVAECRPRMPCAAVTRISLPPFSTLVRQPASRTTSMRLPSGANPARASSRESSGRGAGAVSGPERRLPKTALAWRLEHTLIRRAPCAGSASFALRAGNGRVHLLVRSDGVRTRLIAVCAPSLRERVERALAHARFALVGRGVAAEVA
jgi:hypothetical protein